MVRTLLVSNYLEAGADPSTEWPGLPRVNLTRLGWEEQRRRVGQVRVGTQLSNSAKSEFKILEKILFRLTVRTPTEKRSE